jgi:hypothetical protein
MDFFLHALGFAVLGYIGILFLAFIIVVVLSVMVIKGD